MIPKTQQTILHLSLINGVGPATVLKLTRPFVASDVLSELPSLYDMTTRDVAARCSISLGLAERVVRGLSDVKELEQEMLRLEQGGFKLLTIIDSDYPQELLHIHLPPPVIYCKGAPLSSHVRKIAIVGSRNATPYARRVTQFLTPQLVRGGWTIVSGGAIGVDTMAHEGALSAGGSTIAVLGSGLLSPYPQRNIKLFQTISDHGGTVVSIFPLTAQPLKGNFPARNRIISGLSQGCLLVAAGGKSGAKITAQCALEQGKQVFAVPGSIFDEYSRGCHDVIDQGAKLVRSAEDILEELAYDSSNFAGQKFAVQTIGPPLADSCNIAPAVVAADPTLQPTVEADPILLALSSPMTLDDLCLATGEDISQLQSKLFDMQLEGKITQNFAGSWEKIL